MHKGHDHTQNGAPYTNGRKDDSETAPMRTTSTFTTSAQDQTENDPSPYEAASQRTGTGSDGTGWQGDSGFGGSTEEQGFVPSQSARGAGSGETSRPLGAGKRTGSSIEEEVTVSLLEEKEGMFLFQHRNYEVTSVRKNSKVVRRYSDFVWLLDCLYKRYPFRQLPLLPPKRVAGK